MLRNTWTMTLIKRETHKKKKKKNKLSHKFFSLHAGEKNVLLCFQYSRSKP